MAFQTLTSGLATPPLLILNQPQQKPSFKS